MGDSNITNTNSRPRTLYAFDFDHTILHGNSDTEVVKVTPAPLPPQVKATYDGTNWTQFMNRVFSFLHENGVSVDKMAEFVTKMTPTPGMVSLLQEINSRKSTSDSKLLVISDANDVFINSFLASIHVSADSVITNPASITPTPPPPNEGGLLQIRPYENQDHCAICPKNLCKGAALEEHLKREETPFSSIVYVGDGRNDVCPGIKLSASDFLFVRRGYGLEKIIKCGKVQGIKKRKKDEGQEMEMTEIDLDIKAQIHYWDDAETIRNVLFGANNDGSNATTTAE